MNSSRVCALILPNMDRTNIAVDAMIIRSLIIWLSTDVMIMIRMNGSKTTIQVAKDWTNRRVKIFRSREFVI